MPAATADDLLLCIPAELIENAPPDLDVVRRLGMQIRVLGEFREAAIAFLVEHRLTKRAFNVQTLVENSPPELLPELDQLFSLAANDLFSLSSLTDAQLWGMVADKYHAHHIIPAK